MKVLADILSCHTAPRELPHTFENYEYLPGDATPSRFILLSTGRRGARRPLMCWHAPFRSVAGRTCLAVGCFGLSVRGRLVHCPSSHLNMQNKVRGGTNEECRGKLLFFFNQCFSLSRPDLAVKIQHATFCLLALSMTTRRRASGRTERLALRPLSRLFKRNLRNLMASSRVLSSD